MALTEMYSKPEPGKEESMTRQETINELAAVMHDETQQPIATILQALGNLSTAELEGALQEHEQKEIEKQLVRSTRAVEAELKAQKHESDERRRFEIAAEQLRIARNEANFRLVLDSWIRIDGQALSWRMVDAIRDLVAQGKLQFSPGTQEDQERWADEDLTALATFVVDGLRGHQIGRYVTSRPLFETFDVVNRLQHISWMKNLGLDRLNEIAATIRANQAVKQQAGVATSPVQQQQTSALNSGSGIDRFNGTASLSLPQETADGQALDAKHLLRLSAADRDSQAWATFRALVRKHGYQALTDRIQGRG